MKKILNSMITKIAACILIAVLFSESVFLIFDATKKIEFQDENIYSISDADFENSQFAKNELLRPFWLVSDAYYEYTDYFVYDGDRIDAIRKHIVQGVYEFDKNLDYYISINGELIAYSNHLTAGNESYFNTSDCFLIYKLSPVLKNDSFYTSFKNYNRYHLMNNTDNINDEILICAKASDEFVKTYKPMWELQANIIRNAFENIIFILCIMLVLFIYLIIICKGRSKVDKIWTEVSLFIWLTVVFFCTVLFVETIDAVVFYRIPEYMGNVFVNLLSLTAIIVTEVIILSVVRNIKNKEFLNSWLTVKICRALWRRILKIKGVLSRKTTAIIASILFVYTVIIGLLGVLANENFLTVFIGFACFLGACVFLGTRINDLDEIKQGASEIRNGNLTYKIGEIKSEDYRQMAEDINEIGEGLSSSVTEKLRAERMKTELITNVSHDLKTPLTSIINYAKLLEDLELSEEASDYVKIISKKSERLKNLTADLFDISKVQSGNEIINSERLDLSLLINQSLGEHNSEIENSSLIMCVNVEEELNIYADGKKISRVMDNLISNFIKYSMKNTRVFVSAYENDKKAILEVKNISAYPIDFNGADITERFVRGDKARTEEGNGLGLAIAKSYTEICGGSFEVVTDGDMFKVVIKFEIC